MNDYTRGFARGFSDKSENKDWRYPSTSGEYSRGYRDGVSNFVESQKPGKTTMECFECGKRSEYNYKPTAEEDRWYRVKGATLCSKCYWKNPGRRLRRFIRKLWRKVRRA